MADILAQEKSQLAITFSTVGGVNATINIPNPKASVTEAEIKDLAEHIVTNDLFTPKGENIVSYVKAKVVTSDTDKFDLA